MFFSTLDTPSPLIQARRHTGEAIQDYIAISKYARYDRSKRRRETWSEAVARVRDMHLTQFSEQSLTTAIESALAAGDATREGLEFFGYRSLHGAIFDSFTSVDRKEVLPSMRSLQFGGEAILKKHTRIYNCAFTLIDRLEAFNETFYLLLCGCGVGFSVQKKHISQLPPIAPLPPEQSPAETVVVEDTIEGWAEAMRSLFRAAVDGRRISFDYSLIRPSGAPLRTSGGKAPGPQPLMHALTHVRDILAGAAGRQLRSIEAYDCIMWAAKAVLSGGVRRSATICLFSVDDSDMAMAKTGNWFEENPQRSASNNSAVIVRSKATHEQFKQLFEHQKQFGEPGFYFVDDEDYGCNPCCEIGINPTMRASQEDIAKLREYGYSGTLEVGQRLSGVQFCNLTTLSALAAESPEKFYRLCAKAALIATLQAAYTKFNYLSPVSRLITEREALIGVSICGILDRPDVLLEPDVLRRGAEVVKSVNGVIARALGIQPAARTTCVKPEGTASLLLGTSSGLHPHHAVRYFRRVQTNIYDPVYAHFKKHNPHMCEESVYDPHKRTELITFPIEGPEFGIYRDQLTALDHLGHIHRVQTCWVQAGRRHEKYSPGLHHNVSCTVSVDAHDWQPVEKFIWDRRADFTGISLLSATGDKAYAQAPREALTTPEDIAKWNKLVYAPVDYTALVEEDDLTELKQVVACAGGQCELV